MSLDPIDCSFLTWIGQVFLWDNFCLSAAVSFSLQRHSILDFAKSFACGYFIEWTMFS